jgi:hypothetical protein
MEGICSFCGAGDTGDPAWGWFDIIMGPGQRTARAFSAVHTRLVVRACPTCLGTSAAALRAVLAHPGQVKVADDDGYERCTVLCTHRPFRRRGVGVLLHRREIVTCPSCWHKADVEHLDAADPRPGSMARWLTAHLPRFGQEPA